jgi:hypothetical protein
MKDLKARVIAFYLPQYHPIPENDKYWGKGFTEWRNVGSAKPLFKGHYQPKIPTELGYYDLRMPEIREQQVQLAKEAGIEGFCYWHYWFGKGKELLERPFNEIVNSGNPDFPFCLGWANHDWTTKSWSKNNNGNEVIAKQEYLGKEDHILHFNKYLKAFQDSRYIKVDNKLLFVIFSPLNFKDIGLFFDTWNALAFENGLNGFHFVGITSNYKIKTECIDKKNIYKIKNARQCYSDILNLGFDAVNSRGDNRAKIKSTSFLSYYTKQFLRRTLNIEILSKFNYKKLINNYYVEEDSWENVYPTIIPNYDRSPRSGKQTTDIWYNTTPDLFEKEVKKALELIKDKKREHRILFLQSWNEWGEGNYMEPDIKYGRGYINALKKALYE